jgi:UDP-galactose transporter
VGIAIVQAPEAFIGFSTMSARLQSKLAQAFPRQAVPSTYTLLETRHIASKEAHLPENLSLKRVPMNPSRGLLALIAISLISGITGVYFEKVLKESPASVTLWARNAQLSFFSIFPALFIGVLWQDGEEIGRRGFFVGYSSLVWAIVLLQASGGIVVAVCIKYADNIEKNFATSISVVLSCLGSAWFFDTPLTISVRTTFSHASTENLFNL